MSHKILENLKYTKEHEWALIEGDVVTIGITDFAQSSLGDVVFVELPEQGDFVEKDGTFGVVESIKSVSDLYSPVSGEIIAVNGPLTDTPETCNLDPYGKAWMIKIKLSNTDDLLELLSWSDYQQICAQ